ncbi:antifungal protein ginkbilobin-like protein 2 [Aristolochia californica]|uniref:antifungal protein ginkbilobin-like protein 2 n=1 Tax=Aristolochia californica TaxID=171875 RepID=UPI0035DC59BE
MEKMVSVARMMPLIGLWALLCKEVNGVPNTNLTRLLCNGETFTGGDAFARSLAYLLDDLDQWRTTLTTTFAYGQAKCVITALSHADCKTCLKSARETMFATFVSRIGARAVLYDCNNQIRTVSLYRLRLIF